MSGLLSNAISALLSDCREASARVEEISSLASGRHVAMKRTELLVDGCAPVYTWTIHFHSEADVRRFHDIVAAMIDGGRKW